MTSSIYRIARTYVLETEHDRQAMIGLIRSLVIPVKPRWRIVVEPDERKRSSDQNRLYWKVLEEIAARRFIEGRPFAAPIWHVYFKREFLPHIDVELPDGSIDSQPMSTTDLTTSEMSDYITKVEQRAAEWGIVLEDSRPAAQELQARAARIRRVA